MLIAMLYPCVLLGVAAVAVTILFLWVLPKFATVFADVGVELPAITAFMLGLSHFFRSYIVFIVIAIIAAAVGARMLLTVPSIRYKWLRFLLKFPLIGTIIRFGNTAKSMGLMGALWESGLPITEVTRLTSGTMSNQLYRDFFDQLRERLVDGKRISSSFATTDLFGPTVGPLIRTGEETGQTPVVLAALAEYHDKETRGLIKTMLTLMEPLIIVLMAGAVGVIAISVVVPMFRLSQAVH
jgi:type II secretory pathway component PulF